MRPGPKKPGESAAEYSARVKAMEQKWMSGGRPKTSSGDSGPRRDRDTSPSKPVRVMPGKTPMRVTGGMGSSSSDRSEKMRAASEKAASQKESQMKMRAAAAKASEMKARTMGGSSSKMGPGSVRTGSPVMRAKGGMVKGKK